MICASGLIARAGPKRSWLTIGAKARSSIRSKRSSIVGGTINGTLFGPQGRLRISLRDLGVLMQMLLDDGRHAGQPFHEDMAVC